MDQRNLGEDCRRGAVAVVLSRQVGLPRKNICVIEVVLDEELLIWGIAILGEVCGL